nr:DUF6261 family protein [Pedobacter sp. ASV2]
MKKLHELRLTKLSQLELGQFVKRNLDDLVTMGIEVTADKHIAVYIEKLKVDVSLYDQSMLQVRAQAETLELIALDEERDLAFAILKRQLKVFELSNNKTEIDAYIRLNLLFTTYKALPKLNYEAESNAIINLVADLENATYAPLVEILSLNNHINRLKIANDLFNQLFSKRSTITATKVVFDAKALRKNLTDNYNTYSRYVLALAIAEDNVFYNALLDLNNTARKYFSDLLAKRNYIPDNEPTLVLPA